MASGAGSEVKVGSAATKTIQAVTGKRYAWMTQGYVVVAVSLLGDVTVILVCLTLLGIFKPPCKKPSKPGEGVDGDEPLCKRRVCYYPSWAHSRKGSDRFLPENLNASLCSHIHFAYAKLSRNRLIPWYSDDVNCTYTTKSVYFRINKLKRKHKGLKTLLSVGGWATGPGPFTRLVRTYQSRQEFADTSAHFVDGHGFDGLDLDWQYPGYGDSSPTDRERFTSLVQQLRKTFDNYSAHSRPADSPLLLTAAVAPGNRDRIQRAYQLGKLHKLLDYMSVMTFDLHGPWQNVTGSLSPLYSKDNVSMDWAARYYSQEAGVPRNKLLLAISTFGRKFTLRDQSDTSPGAPAVGSGREVRGTQEEGSLAYYQICKRKEKKQRNSKQKTPYLVNKKEWISFEDTVSVREKADYVKKNGYGGVVLWTPALDDFTGTICGQGRYPLMTAVTRSLCHR